MLLRLSRLVIALAACCSVGGHWLGLQSIAWATMMVKYSQSCSVAKAIEQTFDGDHPCDLCKHISKERNTERKQDKQSFNAKADLICVIRAVSLRPSFKKLAYREFSQSWPGRFSEPPSPPPRVASA